MAEGLKMFYARYISDKTNAIPVSDIKPEAKDGLICQYCEAKISLVSAHKRNGRQVSTYLRLQKNAKHSTDCDNMVRSAVNKFVAQSRNAEDDEPIFEEENKTIIFRMNILIKSGNAMKAALIAMNNEPDPEKKSRKRTQYQRLEKQLSSYLNSASGIAKIRARIEESSDKKLLSDLIKIDLYDQTINWNDFFYDEDRYPILFKRANKINHPIAILLTVKEPQKCVEKSDGKFYSLKGEICNVNNNDNTKNYFSPSLTSFSSSLLNTLKPQEEIIVVGYFRTSTNPWKNGITYKNLNFIINDKKQIKLLKG